MELPQHATIIGAGRLAHSLISNLQRVGIDVQQVLARRPEAAQRIAQRHGLPRGGSLSERPTGQLVFLAVADGAIREVAQALLPSLTEQQCLVHSSGSIPLTDLPHVQAGVLYPMQAFPADTVVPFDEFEVPLFVEGNTPATEATLLTLAEALSPVVQRLSSVERLKLHLGAVLSCNFANLLWRITDELLPEVAFDTYRSLIQNQVQQAFLLGPAAAQTGPALRADLPTLQRHLALLEHHPELQQLYRLCSVLINPEVKESL